MKTAVEAAREYSENIHPTDVYAGPIKANLIRDKQITTEKGFLAGVEWAERWIPVDELPTHWRPIKHKTTIKTELFKI